MNNFNREWEFITIETHNKKFRKANLIEREILFGMQVLLSRIEMKNYFALRDLYFTEKSKQRKI